MFGLFKKKNKSKRSNPLLDLNGNPLLPGDEVEALRYELGRSKLIEKEGHFYYVSESSGKEISFTKMIDAITGNQKVNKID